MTGAYEGIIGSTRRTSSSGSASRPRADGDGDPGRRLCGAVVDVDETTGKARSITPLQERL
jgi:hypothetical protein